MRPHELAKEIGVSVETLRRWDRTGKLKAKRTQAQSSLLYRRRFSASKRTKTYIRRKIN